MMHNIYPMFFDPVLKDYIWGGRNLAKYGWKLPETGPVAESWEISSHEDGMTHVINGPLAGKSLLEVLNLLGTSLVGTKNKWALERGKFPLLVKILDAEKRLSVQVHPDDAYAQTHEGNELGKTEMWVVLDAKPDAAIVYGLSDNITPDEFRKSIDAGELEKHLHKINIQREDHICVPSGTLHAILEGALLVEIQQNSNTTYRVFDWNRLGDGGKPRELHQSQALDVIDFNQVRSVLHRPKVLEETSGMRRERLCQNSYFTTDRYYMKSSTEISGVCNGTTFEIWGVLSGTAEIAGEPMSAVQFVLLPAALGEYSVKATQDTVLLRSFVL